MKSTYKLVKRDGLYRLTDALEKNERIIYHTGVISYIAAKYEIERNLELFFNNSNKYYEIAICGITIAVSRDVEEITKEYRNVIKHLNIS